MKSEMINGEKKWKEAAVTRMRLKAFIARVTRTTNGHNVFGVILHDGTPIRSVEVRVDDGPWRPAMLDPATTREKYAWKFFNYTWNDAAFGEHTVTSRVIDIDGVIQPTAEELQDKRTFLEANAQLPRTVMIA